MMKMLTKAVLTTVLASGAVATNVYAADASEREQCQSQVAEVYRDAADMQFVGERRFHDGTRMQYAVHSQDADSGYTTTRLAVCWLGNDNYQAYTGEMSETMVADVDVDMEDSLVIDTPLLK